jgi:hypothetical protein
VAGTGKTFLDRDHTLEHFRQELWVPALLDRQYDYADIIPESPFAGEFIKKYGNELARVEGVGNEGDLKHVDNFLDCVRSRQQPNCHADLGYKVMATVELSVRSYRNGKVYYFDAEREQVVEKV